MVSDISKINIVGKCFNSINYNETKIFDESKNKKNSKVTIIFGKNGSGKSTFTQAISEFKDDNIVNFKEVSFINFDNNRIPYENIDKKNFFIFGDNFKNKIRFSSSGLESIIMYGKQIEIDEQKKIELEKEETLKTNLSDKKKLLEKNNTKKKNLEDSLRNNLKETWCERDKDIRKLLKKSHVTDQLFNSIIDIYQSKKNNFDLVKTSEKYNQKKESYHKSDEISKIPLIKIDTNFNDKNLDTLIDFLSKDFNTPQSSNREDEIILKILESSKKNFFNDIKDFFNDKTKEYCPFCFQPISSETQKNIIDSINKIYMNESITKFKEQLSNLKNIFKKIDIDLKTYEKLDTTLLRLSIDEYNKLIDNIHIKIDEKINNVYLFIDFDKEDFLIKNNLLNENVLKINNEIHSSNKTIERKKVLLEDLNLLNKIISMLENQTILENYCSTINDISKINEDIVTCAKDMDLVKTKLQDLNAQYNDVYIAQDLINKFLKTISLSKKIRVIFNNNQYQVNINKKPISLENLSEGEKNIISLCYFFATIFEKREKISNIENSFLIIDDPISSFDYENKIGILSLFRFVFDYFLNSNNNCLLLLSHDLQSIIDMEKVIKDCNKNLKINFLEFQNYNFKKFELKDNFYSKLLNDIFDYANNNCDYLDNSIGNIIRKVLEAYSTFNYRLSISELTTNKEILELIDDDELRTFFKNYSYAFVLNNESHQEDNIKTLNFLNIDEYISRESKINIAKNILIFLFVINKYHLKAHLKENEKILKIENWLDELKQNYKEEHLFYKYSSNSCSEII